MATVNAPLRTCRAILREVRCLKGCDYKNTMIYSFVLEQFRKNQVTSEHHCRALTEAAHLSHTYLCLLQSTRHHLQLHNQYHGKGERLPDQVAHLVGLRLPTQPGGKGWEK